MIVLMMYHYGMSDRFQFVLDTMNNLLLGVFGLEMLLKMFALGVKRYWKEPTNVFDGVIVIGSLCVSLLTLNSAFKQYSFISQVCTAGSLFMSALD